MYNVQPAVKHDKVFQLTKLVKCTETMKLFHMKLKPDLCAFHETETQPSFSFRAWLSITGPWYPISYM